MSYYYQDLRYDLQGIEDHLSTMNNQLSSGFSSMGGHLSTLEATIDLGLAELSEHMKELIEEFIGFRAESYLQNEMQNQHLEQIELSLKTPMQTKAMEHFNVAVTLINRGNGKIALKHLLDAHELYPLHFRTYIHLSQLYLSMKDYDQALDYAEQSISHAPIDSLFDYRSLSYQLIGKVHSHTGRHEQAYQAIKRATQHATTPEIQYDYARYAALSNHHSEVLFYLEKAIFQKKELFSSALLDCGLAFASMKEETVNFLHQLKQSRSQLLHRLIEEARKVCFYEKSDAELVLASTTINSNEKEQIKRRMAEAHEALKTFKIAEERQLNIQLDEAERFLKKNTYLDTLEGLTEFEKLQDYTTHLPERFDSATQSLYYFSPESKEFETVKAVEDKVLSLKKAVLATENTLKMTPLFDFSERKKIKAKKQDTLVNIKKVQHCKLAVETDVQLLNLFTSAIEEIKTICTRNARPIVQLDFSTVLTDNMVSEMEKPLLLSKRIERIVSLIESETETGNIVSWNKGEQDEWLGSANWFFLIDHSLNELRKYLIPLAGRNIQMGESLQLNGETILSSIYTDFRTKLPAAQLIEGRLLDETGKRDDRHLRFIEWNGEKLAIEEKYAQIALSRRVYTATAEGPISLGENNQFVVKPIRY